MRFESDPHSVNRASFAGRWYPGSPDRLRQELDTFLEEARSESESSPQESAQGAAVAPAEAPVGNGGRSLTGAILPHAGLSYSGAGMAEAFARLEAGRVEQILLLSPSHYYRLAPDTLYVERFAEHETPLGPIAGAPDFWRVPEDRAPGRGTSSGGDKLRNAEEAIEGEHGTELFFPFIRHTLGPEVAMSLVLVPELTSLEAISALADIIDTQVVAGKGWDRTLLLVSSDFTHYGPPFRYTPYGTAADTGIDELETRVAADDTAVARTAAQCDVETLFERFQGARTTVCGRYPILLGTELLGRRKSHGRVARYYNSNAFGRRSGEFVCYASVLFGRERDA